MKHGDRLGDLVRRITLTDSVAYGAATWDQHRLHYDDQYISERGLPRPIVDGQMLGALLAEQILRELGPDTTLQRLHFRNRSPVYIGDEVRCEATVGSVDGDVLVIDQRIVVGDSVVVAPAGAVVRVPN